MNLKSRIFCFSTFGVVAAATLGGCVSRDYIEVMDFPDERWGGRESVVFGFHPLALTEGEIMPQAQRGEWIDICVRHRPDFPLAELLLEVKGVRPDKLFWVDTVSIRLAEPIEEQYRWLGRHYSNHHELTARYRTGIRYALPGEYAVSIRQLCTPAEESLSGILSIGLVASGCRAAN